MLSTPQGLAFAFRCEQPAGVPRIKQSCADNIGATDRVNVMIDFDADGKTAYNLTVSLSDSIEDAVVTDENQFSTDWDADWQHAVQKTPTAGASKSSCNGRSPACAAQTCRRRTVAVYFDRVIASRGERSATPPVFYGNQVFLSGYEKLEIARYRAQLLDFFPYVSVLQDLKNSGTEVSQRHGRILETRRQFPADGDAQPGLRPGRVGRTRRQLRRDRSVLFRQAPVLHRKTRACSILARRRTV